MKKVFLLIASIPLLLGFVTPAQAATTTAAYNNAAFPISVACTNPGTVHVLQGNGSGYVCRTDTIWLRTPCGYVLQQRTAFNIWFNWRPLTGWHEDSNGGDFRLKRDNLGCD